MPAFHMLKPAFDAGKTDDLHYAIFDMPYLNGVDLRGEPLELRRQALEALLDYCPLEQIRFSPSLDADPVQLLANCARLQGYGSHGDYGHACLRHVMRSFWSNGPMSIAQKAYYGQSS